MDSGCTIHYNVWYIWLFFSTVENGLRSELIKSRYCQNFGPHSDYDQEVSDQAGKLDWIKNWAEASQWLKNSRCAKWLQAEEAPFPLLSGASPSLISQVQPAALPVDALPVVAAVENNKHIQTKIKVQIKRQTYNEKAANLEEWENKRKRTEIQRKCKQYQAPNHTWYTCRTKIKSSLSFVPIQTSILAKQPYRSRIFNFCKLMCTIALGVIWFFSSK